MKDQDWRNRYYATTIVHALTVAVELQNQRRISKRHPPLDYPHEHLPLETRSIPSFLLSTSCNDDRVHRTSRNSTVVGNSASSPSLPLSQASSPGSNVDHATSTDEWQHCCFWGCHVTFKGKPADRRKNFQRHLEEKHIDHKMYRCGFLGCEKEYTGVRNLRRHVKRAHPASSVESDSLPVTHHTE